MARLVALLVILATMMAVQRVAPTGGASTVALPLGFSLIAAYLMGSAAERLRLPRLSGYLLFGLLCGPYLLNLITAAMARDLQLVNGFALALIALVAGLELNAQRLRPHLRALLILGAVIVGGTLVLLTILLWVAWPWLSLPDPGSTQGRWAAALVAATLVASFSPTVTLAVVAEARSRGPLTDLVLAVVVLADLVLIVVFALAMQFARWNLSPVVEGDVGLGAQLSWEIFGSLAFGGIVGAAFAVYLRVVGRELTLVLLAVCALLAVVAPALHFELILSALAAGLVVENLAPPEGDQLRIAIERGAPPVLIVFFATAGASLQLDVLAAIGGVGLALALVRFGLIRATAEAGVRLAGMADTPVRFLWMGLISQAGVTLGLATITAVEFPGWGDQLRTLIVALTGLHVLAGPILLKAALRRAGEIGRAGEADPAQVEPTASTPPSSPPAARPPRARRQRASARRA
jgi:Kef-type K+ transport system membrane component KefB